VAPIAELTHLIIDRAVSDEQVAVYEAAGISVIHA
jgi:hypothetical protein